jgi:hypothetical protein
MFWVGMKDANNRIIGKVDHLLVNKTAERVVYLDVEVDTTVIEEGHETYDNRVPVFMSFKQGRGKSPDYSYRNGNY